MSADVLLVESEVWLQDKAQRTKHLILRLYVPTPTDKNSKCRYVSVCDEHTRDRFAYGIDPWQAMLSAIALLRLQVELELRGDFLLYWFEQDIGDPTRAIPLRTLFSELEPA